MVLALIHVHVVYVVHDRPESKNFMGSCTYSAYVCMRIMCAACVVHVHVCGMEDFLRITPERAHTMGAF